jgi:hypothetical protein
MSNTATNVVDLKAVDTVNTSSVVDLAILNNKNHELVARVSSGLPALDNQSRMFDRNNSQTTLSMMSLTMLNGQSPMRMLRQVLAEVEKRKGALVEAQHTAAKIRAKVHKLEALKQPTSVEEAKLIKESFNLEQIGNKINGSLKDIATLMDSYDSIKEKNGIGDWSEEDYEREEKAHHVRRGFELMYRNLIEGGHPKEATIEYLTQYGVHTQLALAEVSGYIEVVNRLIAAKEVITSSHLEDFFDEMKVKYQGNADIASTRVFGKAEITNPTYMTMLTNDSE